ncbi:MAG: di-heme oxidoredictase family protein, partial [Phycisphaerales bacterium]|nr:di-heme oxidoredictase family protein [Phycisphaerales bacterium]
MNKIVTTAAVVAFVFCWATHANAASDDRTLQPRAGDPLPGLTMEQLERFNAGRVAYASEISANEGHGPIFNAGSCFTCHGVDGGNGIDAVEQFGMFDTTTGFDPMADFGGPVRQTGALPGCAHEEIPEGQTLEDGTVLPVANVTVNRRTIGTMGFGLVEAILDADILANEANNAGTVSGRAHRVDALEEPGVERIGRFGWKAQLPSVLSFSADAARNELGLTNWLVETENQPNDLPTSDSNTTGCDTRPEPEAGPTDAFLNQVVDFQRFMAPPPQAPRANLPGEAIFTSIGCARCHVPGYTTPDDPALEAALRGVTIKPYSDFLLHDLVEVDAGGNIHPDCQPDGIGGVNMSFDPHEMRTPALWGLRDREIMMHRGDAGNRILVGILGFEGAIDHAVAAHRKEGDDARLGYEALPEEEKDSLIQFMSSLGGFDFDLDGDGDVDEDDLELALQCLGVPVDLEDPCLICDLNSNGVVEAAEVNMLFEHLDLFTDCNSNGLTDQLDLLMGFSSDSDGDDLPDECVDECPDVNTHFQAPGGEIEGNQTLESTIDVSAPSGAISSLRVTLRDFQFPWVNKLNIKLTHRRPGESDTTVFLGALDGSVWFATGTYVFLDDFENLFGCPSEPTLSSNCAITGNSVLERAIIREGLFRVSLKSMTLEQAFADGRSAEGEWILEVENTDGEFEGWLGGWSISFATLSGDTDDDGIADCEDDCPNDFNNDADGDGVCGDVDQCEGHDDNIDSDGDDIPDGCDACPNDADNDADGDGVCGDVDQCEGHDDNIDSDGDGTPDGCDACPNDADND